ncbi:MAG: hypothetical protein EBT90_03330 [Rhodobacteraceae bacterium]|jgi:hypothetical protein|nr:hypothetical protein [Paracoccaceae bacterium]
MRGILVSIFVITWYLFVITKIILFKMFALTLFTDLFLSLKGVTDPQTEIAVYDGVQRCKPKG